MGFDGMTDEKCDQDGQREAHTRAGSAPPATGSAEPALSGRDVETLLAGSPDVDAEDLLGAVAELSAKRRRGRGRPPGAGNKKNVDQIEYLAALGHRDPWLTLSMIQTADTAQLAEMLRTPMQEDGKPKKDGDGRQLYNPPDFAGAIALQMKAAADLMPYHHSKRPQPVELPDGAGLRPVMLIGQMNVDQMSLDGMMSADAPPQPKTIDNQDLSKTPAVRETPCEKNGD